MKHLLSIGLAVLLLVMSGSAAMGAGNAARYFDGLDAMGEGRFADAISAIDDAIAANNQIGIYFTDRAVALMALERGAEAGDALHQAALLNQEDNDSRVWSYAWVLMFKRISLPPATQGPPFLMTPYAEKLLTAAADYGSTRNAAEKAGRLRIICQIAGEFGNDQFTNTGPAQLLARVAHLDESRQYALCIALVEKVRQSSKEPIDSALTAHMAHSRQGMGDVGGARAEYTVALRQDPTNALCFLGRARCEIAMGSLAAASADIECAKSVDPVATSGQEQELRSLLSAAQARQGGESAAALMKELADAVALGKSDDELTAIAERLQRGRLAERFIPAEQFTREYCRLRHAVDQDPDSRDKKIDLASFLIRPTIAREISIGGIKTMVAVPCGQCELDPAGHLLADVLKADPKNVRALEQSAWLLALRGRTDAMISIINDALAAGGLDFDLAELNLNYCTSLADIDLDKSRKLRTVWTSTDYQVVNGKTISHIRAHEPTADQLAEADQLEQKSKDLRVQAHNPLAQLINNTQGSSDPATKAVNALAWAYHWEWMGEDQKAVGAAVAAVETQPGNLAALDYLIYLGPKVGLPELGLKYQDQKDSLSNPCPNAQLRAFQSDMKTGKDDAAEADLEAANAVDPGSVALQMARLELAVHRQRPDEIAAQTRVILAMEAGRMRMSGRTFDRAAPGRVSLEDARISVIVCVVAGNALEKAGDDGRAIEQYERGLSIAGRVPVDEIADPGSFKAPLLSSQPDLGTEERAVSLQGLLYDMHRRCACRLLMRNSAAAAAPHCVAMLRLTRSADSDQIAERIGYLIYRKQGWAALPGPLPVRWQGDFSEMDQHPVPFTAASLLNQPAAPSPQNQPTDGDHGTGPNTTLRRPDGSQYRVAQ